MGSTNKMTSEGNYRHLYVVIEQEEGEPIPVSLEMLGEARRLIDEFNEKYSSNEKVVAILLGKNVRKLCEELIFYGADAVIYAESQELQYPINLIDTKVISQIAKDKQCIAKISPEYTGQFKKPRYMFFAADNIGRHLSSTVLAELESGLASDINKLVVEDLEIRHEHKTKGQPSKYEKTLEMYRPDFSGFLWTTILCLDNRNPLIEREYHPQACSIIPGVFQPLQRDITRKGIILDYVPKLEEQDLKVKILSRKIIKSAVDFDSHKAIISFGRGIKESPEENLKLIEKLAKELDAEIGISLPISKKPYKVSETLSSTYMIPDRVIGTSGRKVMPLLYIAAGISGAMQHIAGMKESEFVIAINPDENSPIKDECDVFIKGRMENVIPLIIEEIRKQKLVMEVME
jgi:electron transfer flavoprotein alpha subunit